MRRVEQTGAEAIMKSEIPNIRHSFTTSEFDKDVGWTETITTIGQTGDRVTVTQIRNENGTQISREEDRGRIGRLYPAQHLVQLLMESGNRLYFNTQTKDFDHSAELIFRRTSFPGFDYKKRDHARLIYRHLHAIASVFLQTPPLADDVAIVWSRQDMGEQGVLNAFLLFDATLVQTENGTDWFGVWAKVLPVEAPSCVMAHFRKEGQDNMDVIVKCPPEWHPELNQMIDGLIRTQT